MTTLKSNNVENDPSEMAILLQVFHSCLLAVGCPPGCVQWV